MKTLFLTLFLLLTSPTLLAANTSADSLTTDSTSMIAENADFNSPRATFRTFLNSMEAIKKGQPHLINKVLKTLDLSGINALIRQDKGRDLAWMLLETINKTKVVELNSIPNYKNGTPYVFASYRNGDISLKQQPNGFWQFTQDTLSSLPAISEELINKKSLELSDNNTYLPWHIQFRQQLPDSLRARSFLLENWKWLAILLVIALGVVSDKLSSFILQHVIKNARERISLPAFKDMPDDLLRPLGMMIMAAIWWVGLNLLALPEQAMLVLLVAVKILAGISGVWGAYRVVDAMTLYLRYHAEQTDNKVDDVLVPLISKTLKVFITVIGITFIASNLNLNVSSLLASLGLGGLAFALAAKDVVQNVFGSITVILDQTFHKGDWILVNDIEGSVEDVGLRSTKIRTFYDSLITVPNSIFITANVDNMGQRRFRRLSCKVSVTYDSSPEKIESFCEGIRELIQLHPYMRKDYYQVYLNELASSSLDILVYVFWETPDWSTELRERQRFLLDILRLAKALNIELAFPTQTLHLHTAHEETEITKTSAAFKTEQPLNSKEVARQIVEQTTGLHKRPAPVKF